MFYSIGYTAEGFETLKDVKAFIEEHLEDYMETNGLALVSKVTRTDAHVVKEVEVTVRLVTH